MMWEHEPQASVSTASSSSSSLGFLGKVYTLAHSGSRGFLPFDFSLKFELSCGLTSTTTLSRTVTNKEERKHFVWHKMMAHIIGPHSFFTKSKPIDLRIVL